MYLTALQYTSYLAGKIYQVFSYRIEEIVEEMKERDRGEKKMNESEGKEEIRTFPTTITCCKDNRPCPTVSQYQLDTPVMQDTQHLCLTQPPPSQGGWIHLVHDLQFASLHIKPLQKMNWKQILSF